MKTIIIGLGNPLLGDDGVGWLIAEQLQNEIKTSFAKSDSVSFECLSLGGLGLMEHLIGFDRAILIDTVNLHNQELGMVLRFDLAELPDPSYGHTTSAHDTSLANALQVASQLGVKLPDRITVVGIVSPNVYEFSETLSPQIAKAVPIAKQVVMEILQCDQLSRVS